MRTVGLEDIISFILGNSGQNKAFSKEILQIVLHLLEKGQKPRLLETSLDFFLIAILFLL